MTGQLVLGVGLRDDATFDGYYFGPNSVVYDALARALAQDETEFMYLWGAPGSGTSYLLQASCHRAGNVGKTAVYLPLRDFPSLSPAMFEGLESMHVVCVDDLDCIAGKKAIEEAFFDCYNRVRDRGHVMIVAGPAAPKGLGIHLPDLVSRLDWGLTYQLKPLSDEEKKSALKMRASSRGFELSDDVAAFILNHCVRDNKALFALLDKLDHESLAAKRLLTIPFVKEVIF